MPNDHKLTVVIPTFDREQYLRQALDSLSNQTEKSFRVIIFDNASPYDIKSLIESFPSLSIELRQNRTNIGGQANFELALAHDFTTPYVMIFHDDDTIHPEYFAKALITLEKEEKIRWIGSFIRFTKNSDDMTIFGNAPTDDGIKIYSKSELADAFMNNEPIGFSSVIYKRSVLSETKPEIDRFYKWFDRPFMLEACNDMKVAILPFPYINYRIHPAQDSAQPYREHISEMVNLIEYFYGTATPGKKNLIYTSVSSIRTAAVNASSVKDFFEILRKFRAKKLYSSRYLRPYSIAWLGWILWNRLRPRLVLSTWRAKRI